ncbi:MAG: DNA gyrase inhibitor YacG [Hyphomonadaceae bacterium]|nr:DNA gyrase inhibitor YacG [Hyphomonadaceae bacterium]
MSKKKCPVCETRMMSAEFKPFCSKRCADVDLSRWLKGGYAIPGRPSDQADEVPGGPDPSDA